MTKIDLNRCWRCSPPRKDAHRGRFIRIAQILLALIALTAFNPPAGAATVRALQGQVLVNSGQGYRLVDGSTQLGPGATVVANPGAVAQVLYAGGCAVTVQAGSVYVIASQAPCQRGEPTQTGGLTDGTPPGTSGSGSAWAIGAVAVVAGGAAAYFLIPPLSP